MIKLPPLTCFSKVYIDVDDTLIQTTETLKAMFPEGNIDYSVLETFILDIEPFDDAKVFLNWLLNIDSGKVNIISAAKPTEISHNNRISAVNKICPGIGDKIRFFDTQEDKLKFLQDTTRSRCDILIIDDKYDLLTKLKFGVKILVNASVNQNKQVVSFSNLMGMLCAL